MCGGISAWEEEEPQTTKAYNLESIFLSYDSGFALDRPWLLWGRRKVDEQFDICDVTANYCWRNSCVLIGGNENAPLYSRYFRMNYLFATGWKKVHAA